MWGWFGGNAAAKKDAPKKAIVDLRDQLNMLQKRERYLEQQIAEHEAIARKNINTNKNTAKNALRNKKIKEQSLATTQAQISTLEQQVHAIESATLNAETIVAIKNAGKAMEGIHKNMNIDSVEDTLDEIRNQVQLTHEIGDAISRVSLGPEIDDDELLEELDQMEQEDLTNKMLGAPVAPKAPIHDAVSEQKGKAPAQARKEEDDEEEELRKLQAEMAV